MNRMGIPLGLESQGAMSHGAFVELRDLVRADNETDALNFLFANGETLSYRGDGPIASGPRILTLLNPLIRLVPESQLSVTINTRPVHPEATQSYTPGWHADGVSGTFSSNNRRLATEFMVVRQEIDGRHRRVPLTATEFADLCHTHDVTPRTDPAYEGQYFLDNRQMEQLGASTYRQRAGDVVHNLDFMHRAVVSQRRRPVERIFTRVTYLNK
jgi:hypothetical protein